MSTNKTTHDHAEGNGAEQDTTASGQAGGSGIQVPLGWEGLWVLSQRVGPAGEVEVTVIGTQTRARCPRCGQVSAKQHDVRSRRKRDVALGGRYAGRMLAGGP